MALPGARPISAAKQNKLLTLPLVDQHGARDARKKNTRLGSGVGVRHAAGCQDGIRQGATVFANARHLW